MRNSSANGCLSLSQVMTIAGLCLAVLLPTRFAVGQNASTLCDRLEFEKQGAAHWAVDLTQKMCNLPSATPFRDTIIRWASMFNPLEYASDQDIAQANLGLIAYFQAQLLEDPQLVADFKATGDEIAKVEGEPTEPGGSEYYHSDSFQEKLPMKFRASLSQVAGEGPYKNLKPGWVWEAAMKAAGNNPRRAMRVLAMCGHDDVRSAYAVFKDFEEQQKFIQHKRNRRAHRVKLYEKYRKLPPSSEEKFKILAEISEQTTGDDYIHNLPEGKVDRLSCPGELMFIPRALGANVDISSTLKSRIAKIQAPTKGADYLPAKYYHVYLSAFSVCELKHMGMPGFVATRYQKNFAWAYRSMSLQAKFAVIHEIAGPQVRKDYEAKHGAVKTESDYATFLIAVRAQMEKYMRTNFTQNLNQISLSEEEQKKIAEETESRIMRNLDVMMKFYDAAILYRRISKPTEIMGVTFRYTDDLKIRVDTEQLTREDAGFKPAEWSVERYLAVKKLIHTWMVDWEWTVAQHEAGADFANEVCN